MLVRCAISFALGFAILTGVAIAERPPESREDATHVVVGRIERIFVNETQSNNNYVVKIVVDKVERGDGVAENDAFFVECFQRKRNAPRIPSASGHKSIPKADQQIRAWVMRDGPRSEAIYGDWFQVLPTP